MDLVTLKANDSLKATWLVNIALISMTKCDYVHVYPVWPLLKTVSSTHVQLP